MIKVNTQKDTNKALVIGYFENDQISKKYISKIGNYSSLLSSQVGKVTKIHTYQKGEYDELIYVGLGKKEEVNIHKIRKSFAKAFKENSQIDLLVDNLVQKKLPLEEIVSSLTYTFIITNYQFKKIGAKEEKERRLSIISKKEIEEPIKEGIVIGEAINHARDLANMPSNMMNPIDFVNETQKILADTPVSLKVFDKNDLSNMKAGGILAVNQGSDIEPRMLIMEYLNNPNGKTLAFVGKGITFDSGGYNLKPGASMLGMKYDMCGASNVVAAMEIIAKLQLNVNVIGITPLTENMINGHGLKCDDVITMLSGKTVEVTNTDAEGRLILADGLTYAQSLGATYLVDMATLTGACVAALGTKYTGGFSNDDNFYNLLVEASIENDEPVWRLPLDEDYTKIMRKSEVADLVNSVKTSAGASLAAGFLSEFIEKNHKWIHLDIAGTADSSSPNDFGPAGATGVMIRTLVSLAKKFEK